MPDPIVPYTPFGEIPAWPPSPARLDRELDAQNNSIVNVDWSGDPINLATDVTGRLPYANMQQVTAQRLLGRDSGTGDVQEITLGSNLTLTGGTLSAATSGGAGTGDFSTNTSTSVAGEIVLFSNTTGKQGKRSQGTGICKLTSGVLSTASFVHLDTEVDNVLPATSFPALTGAVTTSAGSVATTIAPLAVTNAMLAGGIAASNLIGTDIATVGTITNGQWAGTPIPVAYGGTGASSPAVARAALGIQTTTPTGDTDYSITASDSTVSLNAALTAPRTWTLPQASTVNDGTTIRIADSVAGVSGSNYISITPFAGDTINGSTNAFLLNKQYGTVNVTKVKSTGWVVLSTTSIVRRFFTSNQTYTTPVGIKSIFVEVVAGGGGGGGALGAGSQASAGGGGGAGGYASAFINSPASSYLITIGTGGTGGAGAAAGSTGGDTSFGSVVIAQGGNGGNFMATGTSAAFVAGGTGGISTSGDLQLAGNTGGAGQRVSGTLAKSGDGSSTPYGHIVNGLFVSEANGNTAGTGYGNGGGGALSYSTNSKTGGSGRQGLCAVTEYY